MPHKLWKISARSFKRCGVQLSKTHGGGGVHQPPPLTGRGLKFKVKSAEPSDWLNILWRYRDVVLFQKIYVTNCDTQKHQSYRSLNFKVILVRNGHDIAEPADCFKNLHTHCPEVSAQCLVSAYLWHSKINPAGSFKHWKWHPFTCKHVLIQICLDCSRLNESFWNFAHTARMNCCRFWVNLAAWSYIARSPQVIENRRKSEIDRKFTKWPLPHQLRKYPRQLHAHSMR